MSDVLKREIVWVPAFDKRHPDPHQDYGVHGVECRFHLIGDHGAAQFVIYTNWHLPEVTKVQDAHPTSLRFPHLSCHPLPADVGYHRLTPAYEGQDSLSEKCDLLGGRPCYYDGSGLAAKDLFDQFTREGDAVVWRELERRYREDVLDENDTELAAERHPAQGEAPE